ncbi:MAG: exo-alpha-sialidase, partial [bacterium]|nr:exo-alpha-sialidase [bacterium]
MRSRGFHTALLTALVPLAAFGAQAAEQAPAVTVQGMAFEVAIFEEDAVAFGNRDYLWKEVPEQFAGWQFTQTWGGRQSRIEVTPASDGPVYVATAPTQKGVDMAGWESLDGVKFHYTSAGYTALHVYSKQGKAGETISIPQGNWTGVIVLAPEMRAGVIEEFKITPPPGVVIDTSPDFGRIYIGSPSITILPNGSYVASHDWFGPGTPMRQTTVLGSKDRGKTWTRLADLDGQWWSTLFVHEDDLYIIGTTARYGNVAIRRSTDGGLTWTTPDDASAGLLLDDGKYHCAPMPVVVHKGRIWRTMEDSRGGGGWGPHFRAFVMSVPVDADLLNAANWTFSNRLKFDPAWYPGERPGWLEGNVVVPPEGGLVNIL